MEMRPGKVTSELVRPLRVIMFFTIIAALYLAREVLMPAAMAVLFTFLLFPMMMRLRRWGVNHALAVVITVGAAGTLLGGIGFLVTEQVIDLSSKLPDYKDNLRAKLRDLRSSTNSRLSRITGTIRELEQELVRPATQAVAPPLVPTVPVESPPMRVAIVDSGVGFGVLAAEALPVFHQLAGATITGLLLIFLLLHVGEIRERLIAFAGMRHISLTTSALDEAGRRIGKFLRMQALINAIYGTLVAIGLMAFGIPNALLWGVMAFLLRFVPYLGPWLATALPVLLTIAISPGWGKPIAVVGMFLGIEFLCNMILEPILFGASSGMSSLGVVFATVFWAWLWGPIGMILSVPITACLVVMGKHFPQLTLLHQLFGAEVDVPTVGRLYQRLLVGDEVSSEGIIRQELESAPFPKVCDDLLLPTVSELKHDAELESISPAQAQRVFDIIDDVCQVDDQPRTDRPKLLLIAAQNSMDDAAARLIATAAARSDIEATVIPSDALASEGAEFASTSQAPVVVIVQALPISTSHSRRLIKFISGRLGRKQVLIDMVVGAAAATPSAELSRGRIEGIQRETSTQSLLSRTREIITLFG